MDAGAEDCEGDGGKGEEEKAAHMAASFELLGAGWDRLGGGGGQETDLKGAAAQRAYPSGRSSADSRRSRMRDSSLRSE
jgi:hypothetical protein